MTYALELRDITKRFPGVLANDHISLQVAEGEIRALVGENGAGKTTLMRTLYGLHQPDEGEIYLWGQRRTFRSPHDAIQAGLGMVHQHFMLFPSLSAAENIIYGEEPGRAGFIDMAEARRRVAELAATYGLSVPLDARAADLPVGVRQRIEILKMLYRSARILILDEPTAVLTPQERDTLFEVLRRLAAAGSTIIFITHKLNEVMALSHNATVLRGGRVMGTLATAQTTPQEISRLMVGRDVLLQVEKSPAAPGQPVLHVENLRTFGVDGTLAVDDISFEVRAGEILGIAGVAGNGQTELIEALVGLRPAEGGIRLLGGRIDGLGVQARREAGLAYIPEDRAHVGLAMSADIAENMLMGFQRREPLSRRGLLKLAAVRRRARELIDAFAVKAGGPAERAANLSGGNLQKVVVARELTHAAPLLIAEQPTRGVDVGSIEFIHKRLVDYCAEGRAVLLVSAELSEILALSDRVLVMFEGRIAGEVPAAQASEERLGLLMAGADPPA